MRHIPRLLAISALLLGAGVAHAQQSPTPPNGGIQGFEFGQGQVRPPTAAPTTPRPLFFLFGIPVVIDSPVPPNHCNCATQLYAGQPAGPGNPPVVPRMMESTPP